MVSLSYDHTIFEAGLLVTLHFKVKFCPSIMSEFDANEFEPNTGRAEN